MTPPGRPRAPLAAVLVAACLVAGCGELEEREPVRLKFVPPVLPLADPEAATRWYFRWEGQEDFLADDTPVEAIQLFLTMRGRHWRAPDGPDGYALRVALLDGMGDYVRSPGTLKAFLVHRPAEVTSRALCAWEIPLAETERRIIGMPTGYLLQLDWGQTPPPGRGTYMLVVRWESPSGRSRLTANYVFEDFMPNVAVRTTTRRAGSAGL